MRLASNKVIFTDDSSATGSIAFRQNEMVVNKSLNCLKGLVSQGIRVDRTARLVVADEIKDPEATSIALNAVNTSKINLLASDAMLSSYNLIFPPNQGGADEYLQLGNNGALQWTALDGSASQNQQGQENAWNFGTVAQLWCVAEGSPFAAGATKLPITPSPAENAAFFSDYYGIQSLRVFGANGTVISWDVLESSTDWDLRVNVLLDSFDGYGVKGFFLFGNDTIQTASSGNIGIRPQDSTGMLFEVTHNASESSHPIKIREKGVVTKTIESGFPMNNAGGTTFRLQRKGNVLRIELQPQRTVALSGNAFNANVAVEIPLTQSYTGTRWGLGVFGGMSAFVTSIELRRS